MSQRVESYGTMYSYLHRTKKLEDKKIIVISKKEIDILKNVLI